jgi:hypothetical protein
VASDWCSVSLERNKFRPCIVNFPLPRSRERPVLSQVEGARVRAKSRLTPLTFNPLPPKEAEKIFGLGLSVTSHHPLTPIDYL